MPSGARTTLFSTFVPFTTPLTPLTDLTGTYQGQDGGLYGGDSNTPPPSQAAALQSAASLVVPRNARGVPSATGKIGFAAIGQSTTRLEFGTFQPLMAQDLARNPAVVSVNGGQDNQVLQNWAGSNRPWQTLLRDVRAAGLTASQVQVVWIDLAQIYAKAYGALPARTAHYATLMTRVVETAKRLFPDLQVAYISSRIYGGYGPQGVDPEPYAYESGFGVRQTIQEQELGLPALNDNPGLGRAVAPVLAWGPYPWADGAIPRDDGLTWQRDDFVADGVHPSFSGQLKGAQLLLNFLHADPSASRWYLA